MGEKWGSAGLRASLSTGTQKSKLDPGTSALAPRPPLRARSAPLRPLPRKTAALRVAGHTRARDPQVFGSSLQASRPRTHEGGSRPRRRVCIFRGRVGGDAAWVRRTSYGPKALHVPLQAQPERRIVTSSVRGESGRTVVSVEDEPR